MLPPSSGGVNDMAKSEDQEINDVQLCLIWVYIMTISSKVIESIKAKQKYNRAVIPKVCSADHQNILSGPHTGKVWEPLQ